MIAIILFLLAAPAAWAAEAIILDRSHPSAVFGETRHYRIFLPPDYESSGKRYPVVYFFHGSGERYNRCRPAFEYDTGAGYGGDTIAAYVARHDLIVVKWDGYNPRSPGEEYARPYNIGPVETDRQFPLYFPELVEHIDAAWRTIPDRGHRGTSGFSMGGFMAFWVAAKYPDLVASASSFMGSPEFLAGPRGIEVEYRHEEMRDNLEAVRTRLVIGARDFLQFYHRRMNAIWAWTRPHHETEEYDYGHGTPGIAKTFDFHMRAFADPLPRPAPWSHRDIYPNFAVWGWDVFSARRQPGITALENVSKAGFRSAVREWLPGGAALADVKLAITSAPLYPPGQEQLVTYIRVRDGRVRRQAVAADPEGRLTFELDGEEHEVGVGEGAILALGAARVDGARWATAGRPVRLRVLFRSKGGAASRPVAVRWESPKPGIRLAAAGATVAGLTPGAAAEVPLEFTTGDATREAARIVAVVGGERIPFDVPLFPEAKPAPFAVADGKILTVWQRAVEKQRRQLGDGDGDGRAEPGETVAIGIPDGDALRLAELFTNDACVDLGVRASDPWASYDRAGASAKYTLAAIRTDCPPGHVVRVLARVVLPARPNHSLRYAAVELLMPAGAGKE